MLGGIKNTYERHYIINIKKRSQFDFTHSLICSYSKNRNQLEANFSSLNLVENKVDSDQAAMRSLIWVFNGCICSMS